jgi:hypothetical protein
MATHNGIEIIEVLVFLNANHFNVWCLSFHNMDLVSFAQGETRENHDFFEVPVPKLYQCIAIPGAQNGDLLCSEDVGNSEDYCWL